MLPRRSTKFRRFYLWLQRSHSTLLCHHSNDDSPLFPCLLPFPGLRSGSAVAADSTRQERWAREQLNLFCGWHSFLALGCPDRVEKFLPSSWSSSVRALGLAAGMLEEVAAFGDWAIASDSHFPCRTREVLRDMLKNLQEHKYSAKIGDVKIGDAFPGVPCFLILRNVS